MSVIEDTAAALRGALKTVNGIRVYEDPGAVSDPPAAVVGPPTLRWEGPCAEPSSATFTVYLIAKADGRAMPRLYELIPKVAVAIDSVTDAVITTAQPGFFSAGGSELPTYELTVSVGLSE